jgi:hypothetical protein
VPYSKPILEEGEVVCSRCEGEGWTHYDVCPKCQGRGITDWVSNAMSVDATTSITYYSSSSISSTSMSSTSFSATYPKTDPRTEDLKEYAKKVQRYFTGKIFPSKKSSEPIIEDLEQT